MGVSLTRCCKCGRIHYDEHIKQHLNRKNEFLFYKCYGRCLKSSKEYIKNSEFVFSLIDIRWLSRSHFQIDFIGFLDYLINNVELRETEEWNTKLDLINSCSY
jgi:hypothetical protein